jgi:hypothetical protein
VCLCVCVSVCLCVCVSVFLCVDASVCSLRVFLTREPCIGTQKSLDHGPYWIDCIRLHALPHCMIFLVGNKSDCASLRRQVRARQHI